MNPHYTHRGVPFAMRPDEPDGPVPFWADEGASPPPTENGKDRSRPVPRPSKPIQEPPPHNLDAEERVIGGLFWGCEVNDHRWDEVVATGLQSGHFYAAKHQTIFEAIVDVVGRGDPPDGFLVTNRLSEKKMLEKVGGPMVLVDLRQKATTYSAVASYARLIIDAHKRRQLVSGSALVRKAAMDGDVDAMRAAQRGLADVSVDGGPGFSFEMLDEIWEEIEPLEWIWPGWLPRTGLVLLAGVEGTGKTTLTLHLVSELTRGRLPGQNGVPGRVALWTGEDHVSITVGRLIQYGADMSRIALLGRSQPFSPTEQMDGLFAMLKPNPVDLVVFDPLVRLVPGENNNAKDIRDAIEPVVERFAQMGTTVLGLGHFTKDSGDRPIVQRFMGSGAYTQIARAMWAMIGSKDRVVWGKGKVSWGDRRGVYDVHIEERTIEYGSGKLGKVGVAVLGDLDTERNLDEVDREMRVESEADDKNRKAGARHRAKLDGALAWLEAQGGYCSSGAWTAYHEDLRNGRRVREHIQRELEMHLVRRGKQPNQSTWWALPDAEVPDDD